MQLVQIQRKNSSSTANDQGEGEGHLELLPSAGGEKL